MVVVDNVKDFAKQNEGDIRRFLTNSKHIFDPELVNDIIQNFYVRLISSDALSTFDPSIATFNTYIITILCRMLPHERRRNPNARHSHLSVFVDPDVSSPYSQGGVDVFDLVYGCCDHSEYGIKRKNMPSYVFQREEDESIMHIMSFIDFIKESEPNKKKADKMVCFVEHKMQGVLATDIATVLGVSDNMVKIMKNNIYDKYKKWDRPKEVLYA
jgi:DNA-directed RNA polymerase specialized sigma24 family protein